MDKLKIMVVDDESRMRKLVKDFLKKKDFEVIEAADGEEALDIFFKDKSISLIICDVMMPKINGFDVVKEIRQYSQVPIIMLTAKVEDTDKIMGLTIGADDYITKPFSLMVLVSKVQAFMRRMEGVCGHNRILSGNIEVNYGEMRALKRNADGVTPLTLSKKELQIMIYFMENARQILSKEQILEYVWDVDGQFVDDNTVPVNISRLKGKIGNDYIQNVRGMGYIWTEESVQE